MKNAIGSAITTSIDRHGEGHAERAQGDRAVDAAREDGPEVVQRPDPSSSPVKRVDVQNAVTSSAASAPM